MRLFLYFLWSLLWGLSFGAGWFAWQAVAQARPALFAGTAICVVLGAAVAFLIDTLEV